MFDDLLDQMEQAVIVMRRELTKPVITPIALVDYLDGLDMIIEEMRERLEPFLEDS